MSSDISIRVSGVSKSYLVYEKPHHRLLQSLLRSRKTLYREFRALHDVSFEVRKGETVGIVGKNGSGKSTLLQIICGTLSPSAGSVQVEGRVAALLELGAGFNPEFTGRENVYLNASILGFTNEEIDRKVPGIIAFAEIGDYIDQPVKTYSSGMFVRLAFAVAIHVDPTVLIIDEALGVGDIYFQAKCALALDEIKKRGTTILFVSHDTSAIQRISDRCIVLDAGRMLYQGDVAEAISVYYRLVFGARDASPPPAARSPSPSHGAPPGEGQEGINVPLRREHVTSDGTARIDTLVMFRSSSTCPGPLAVGETVSFRMEGTALADLAQFEVGIGVCDRAGSLLGGAHTMFDAPGARHARPGDTIVFECEISFFLAPGEYLLMCGIGRNFGAHLWEDCYLIRDAFAVTVAGDPKFWGAVRIPVSSVLASVTSPEVHNN